MFVGESQCTVMSLKKAGGGGTYLPLRYREVEWKVVSLGEGKRGAGGAWDLLIFLRNLVEPACLLSCTLLYMILMKTSKII